MDGALRAAAVNYGGAGVPSSVIVLFVPVPP